MDVYSGIVKLYSVIIAGLQGKHLEKEQTAARILVPAAHDLEKRVAIETPASGPRTFRGVVNQIMEDPKIKRLFLELNQSDFPTSFRAKYAEAIARQHDAMKEYPIAKEHPEQLDDGAVVVILGTEVCAREIQSYNPFFMLRLEPAGASDYAPDMLH